MRVMQEPNRNRVTMHAKGWATTRFEETSHG